MLDGRLAMLSILVVALGAVLFVSQEAEDPIVMDISRASETTLPAIRVDWAEIRAHPGWPEAFQAANGTGGSLHGRAATEVFDFANARSTPEAAWWVWDVQGTRYHLTLHSH